MCKIWTPANSDLDSFLSVVGSIDADREVIAFKVNLVFIPWKESQRLE